MIIRLFCEPVLEIHTRDCDTVGG
uniref:Uncharacterized protein n=1 Tax=Anguilla anguilla TaxID=7936 RepID=A0A0E9T9T1_ANGAN